MDFMKIMIKTPKSFCSFFGFPTDYIKWELSNKLNATFYFIG